MGVVASKKKQAVKAKTKTRKAKPKALAHALREIWRHPRIKEDCVTGINHGVDDDGMAKSLTIELHGGAYRFPEKLTGEKVETLRRSLAAAGFEREMEAVNPVTAEPIPEIPVQKDPAPPDPPVSVAKSFAKPLVPVDEMPNAGRWTLEHPDHDGNGPSTDGTVTMTVKGKDLAPFELKEGFVVTEDLEVKAYLLGIGYRLYKTEAK